MTTGALACFFMKTLLLRRLFMKKYLLVLFSISIFLTGCATKNSINSDYEFKAEPVIKSVGNIEVIIDPNVEMMNILGRLANLIPYKKVM